MNSPDALVDALILLAVIAILALLWWWRATR